MASTPKTAGKYHAYATEYPEYPNADGDASEVLSTLPVAGHKNRFVPSDTGRDSKAGAGRGGQGGPTAKELKKYEDKLDAGIFTEGKKMPPSPREMAKGGKVSSASSRADGCCIKGKTRGKMV